MKQHKFFLNDWLKILVTKKNKYKQDHNLESKPSDEDINYSYPVDIAVFDNEKKHSDDLNIIENKKDDKTDKNNLKFI